MNRYLWTAARRAPVTHKRLNRRFFTRRIGVRLFVEQSRGRFPRLTQSRYTYTAYETIIASHSRARYAVDYVARGIARARLSRGDKDGISDVREISSVI